MLKFIIMSRDIDGNLDVGGFSTLYNTPPPEFINMGTGRYVPWFTTFRRF